MFLPEILYALATGRIFIVCTGELKVVKDGPQVVAGVSNPIVLADRDCRVVKAKGNKR